MKLRRVFGIGALAVILAAAAGEFAARAALDFPLFGADAEGGYYALPNQRGRFAFRNAWAFNELGMGVAERFAPSTARDVLLVGDSVVYGGNPVRQENKLGPVLQHQTGWHVWPLSAGSWALQNELIHVRRLPQAVRGADQIVFVLNSEDFAEPSSWANEFTHPRHRPASYLLYGAEKALARSSPPILPEFRVRRWPDLAGEWRKFTAATDAPILVVGYPAKAERNAKCAWLPKWLAEGAMVACYGADRPIPSSFYGDPIHPNDEGRVAVAAFI